MTPTVLEVVAALGCALVLVGVMLIYLPAALITAGLMLLLLAVLTYAWGEPDEPSTEDRVDVSQAGFRELRTKTRGKP